MEGYAGVEVCKLRHDVNDFALDELTVQAQVDTSTNSQRYLKLNVMQLASPPPD